MICAIYSRVSTRKYTQETSIKNQNTLCSKYASKENWTIYNYYEDKESASKSGKHDKRDSFKQLIDDAKAKKFDVIITKNLSRLGRNVEELIKIRTLITSKKIHLITLDNKINSLENKIDNLSKLILSCEEELNDLSERTKYGLMARALDGKFNGSIAPYGYICKDGKLFKSTEESVAVVNRIFDEYLNGRGFDSIAKGLYEDDIPTPSKVAGKSNSSNEWHGSSVRCILENPHYTGDLVQSRTQTICATSTSRIINSSSDTIIVPNTHEAIISREKFDLVQKLIESRRRKRPATKSNILSNLIFCADCKKAMSLKLNSYKCSGYIKHGKKYCSSHNIKEKYIIEKSINNIKNIVLNMDDKLLISYFSDRINYIYNNYSNELNHTLSSISRLETRKYKAHISYFDNKISKDLFDKIIDETDIELNSLQNKLKSLYLLKDKIKNINIADDADTIKSIFLESLSPSSKLFNMFIDKIEISENGEPKFFYKF